MKRYLLMLLLLLFVFSVGAQVNIEAPEPYAEVTDKDGEMSELSAGGEFSGEAPVVLKLYSSRRARRSLILYAMTMKWRLNSVRAVQLLYSL